MERRLVQRYGCSGCHLIQGLETAKGIGTSLSEEGSKLLTKFDFGFVHGEHSVPGWISQKLHDPRSFDKDRVKRWDEKLMMPDFGLHEEENQHLTMLIMGLTKEVCTGGSKKSAERAGTGCRKRTLACDGEELHRVPQH